MLEMNASPQLHVQAEMRNIVKDFKRVTIKYDDKTKKK